MIGVCDECDYTILIADLISTLMTLDKDNEWFKVKVWINSTELPLTFESSQCTLIEFLQEGLKVMRLVKDDEDYGDGYTHYNKCIDYIFYDTISMVQVIR